MSAPVLSDQLLSEVSEVASSLAPDDLVEMAALGSLVDWELVKFLGRSSWALLSLSFRWKEDEVLMVIKVRVDEAQYVVFVSRPSPMGCMRTLVRKMGSGTIPLYPDKYQ